MKHEDILLETAQQMAEKIRNEYDTYSRITKDLFEDSQVDWIRYDWSERMVECLGVCLMHKVVENYDMGFITTSEFFAQCCDIQHEIEESLADMLPPELEAERDYYEAFCR